MDFINFDYTFNDRKDTNVQDILNKNVEKVSSLSSESSTNIHINLNITEVTKNLYLCSAMSVHSSTLQLLGVTCVINATLELPDTPLPNDRVQYYRISVYDAPNEDIKQHFSTCSDLIQKVACASGKTLLHCTAGVSRSATLCIAYLMKYHNFTLLDAYNYLKLRRPIIKPNCGFFKQLIDYEVELYDINTVKLVYNELLNLELPDVYDSDYKSLSYFRRKCKNSADQNIKQLS
ncbi:hypothetical protein RN001_007283 [Aquatica leii]|uniref:Protein-tyrosine-phosphatase n=1 Tax=Aquatica leii TaxID=1421715 RepID=A0AAN7SF70_9COLE|nr:hypothetical protein RN001_007283 [Aquatica leii]